MRAAVPCFLFENLLYPGPDPGFHSSKIKPTDTRSILEFKLDSGNQPHLEYPQARQVAQLSITTSALVLHLLHKVADAG